MIAAPNSIAARAPRAPQTKAATQDNPVDDAQTQAQKNALAVQHQAFDIVMEVQAEFDREREALEQLMLARLKDEDEICKKFIALI